MDKVSKRDFIQYPNKYLKPGRFVVTKHGKDVLVVTIDVVTTDKLEPIVVTKAPLSDKPIEKNISKEKIKKVLKEVPQVKTAEFSPNWTKDTSTYGCGCKKTEGKTFCPKHNRL